MFANSWCKVHKVNTSTTKLNKLFQIWDQNKIFDTGLKKYIEFSKHSSKKGPETDGTKGRKKSFKT